MKVLLVAPLPPPYGGITNWSQIMLNYVKNTCDEFCTLNIAPKKRSTEGRNLFDRVVVSGLDMIKKRSELKRIISNEKIDVIHMTTSGSMAAIRDILLMRVAKKSNIPVVYHLHFGRTPEMARRNSFLWKLFLKAMSLASAVVTIDKRTYSTVCDNIDPKKVFLIPNPVDLKQLPEKSEEIKKQVAFLGWVIPAKGINELISAWNTVGKEFSQYELVIIGPAKKEYLNTLEEAIKVKNVAFVGEKSHDEAMKALSKAEAFILPSYTEGFPNAIIEAMALEKAIIASNVGAIPEMLDGDCGVVIESKSESEIISALRKVLSDENYRKYIARNAFEKVKNEYSIEKVYELYIEIWKNLKK